MTSGDRALDCPAVQRSVFEMTDLDQDADMSGRSARLRPASPVLAGFRAVMRRQIGVILLVVAVGTFSAFAYGTMQTPVFEATAVVQVRGPAADFQQIETRLTAKENLIAIAARHRLFGAMPLDANDAAAVQMRKVFSIHAMTSDAGQSVGLLPETSGIVLAVRLADPELAAQVANDLALQVLELGRNGQLDQNHSALMFYREEELRLWQEISALRGEIDASLSNGSVTEADSLQGAGHKLSLMQDQYDQVRKALADQEIAERLAQRNRDGQFGLLQRATSAQAVNVVENWMLSGVAGSLLLAVTMAFVLERRFPMVQTVLWQRLASPVRVLARLYRLFDDPGRPIFGVPRFAVIAVLAVAILIGLARLIR